MDKIGCLPTVHRIGINAHLLAQGESYRRAGVSRYIYNLLLHLPNEDPEGDYTVFCQKGCALPLTYRQRCSSLPTGNPWVRIVWEQFLQPFALRAERITLLHSPLNVQPLALPCKGVVTVMDLSFIVHPQGFRPAQRFYQRVFTRWSVQRAVRIITISTHTAQDLTRLFDVPSARIAVIFPGVDAVYRPIQDAAVIASFRQRHNLPDKLILFVGTLEPRKNLITLLQAYAQFKRQAKTGHKLALVGGRGWLFEPVLAAVQELELQADVLLPGYVPEEELPLWYNSADVFVYPSLYEGFGLPVLEAMACGKPGVVANTSCLPEVVGDAALLVDPHQPGEWADTLTRVCHDADLRTKLSSRALARARQFSWSRMARETARLYHEVLTGDL